MSYSTVSFVPFCRFDCSGCMKPNPAAKRGALATEAQLPLSDNRDCRPSASPSPCQACGACCATSANWPRFSLETDEALDRIPAKFVDPGLARMRCVGNRCSALVGDVGVHTACAIYADRPDVCRACSVGDDECKLARKRHGLPILDA